MLEFLIFGSNILSIEMFGVFFSYLKIYFYSWMHSKLTSPKGNILNPCDYVFIQKKTGLPELPKPPNPFYCTGEMDTRWQREMWKEVVFHCQSSVS